MNAETHRAAIQALIRNWDDALYNKDIARLATFYTPDCITYDVSSQVQGPEAIQAMWEPCLPYFGDHIGIERKEESLEVAGDMALFTCFNRLTGMGSDAEAARSWLRATVVFRKLDGDWKIRHEHISYPFDCANERPAYILD